MLFLLQDAANEAYVTTAVNVDVASAAKLPESPLFLVSSSRERERRPSLCHSPPPRQSHCD